MNSKAIQALSMGGLPPNAIARATERAWPELATGGSPVVPISFPPAPRLPLLEPSREPWRAYSSPRRERAFPQGISGPRQSAACEGVRSKDRERQGRFLQSHAWHPRVSGGWLGAEFNINLSPEKR
jgi:hypothetical protein